MQDVLGFVFLAGLFYGVVKWQKFKWKIGDKVTRRVEQSTVFRDERATGKRLAEGWTITVDGSPSSAMHHFGSSFRAAGCSVKRDSDTSSTLTLTWGRNSWDYDRRQSVRCRVQAWDPGSGTLVAFRVDKSPMTNAANDKVQVLSTLARRVFP